MVIPENNQWIPNKDYKAVDVVTYNGKTYLCTQSHRSLNGWEPNNATVLWKLKIYPTLKG